MVEKFEYSSKKQSKFTKVPKAIKPTNKKTLGTCVIALPPWLETPDEKSHQFNFNLTSSVKLVHEEY